MRRIIVIVVLSVLTVLLSGCDKIKAELERRHLGSEHRIPTALVEKTPDKKQNDVENPLARKQIVIRIDLPADEKLQIRLLKLPVSEVSDSEEKPNDVISPSNETPQNETIKEDAPNAANLNNKSEKTVEPDKKESEQKKPPELETSKSNEPQSEIKTDAEQEPKSEMKTESKESLSEIVPVPAPMIVVPERETTSQPNPQDTHEISALSRFVKSNPAPAEAAVGSALSPPEPATIVPASKAPLNAAATSPKASSPSPWAIPNADYPLRYY